MIARILLLAWAGTAILPAQLQLLVVANSQESPAGTIYTMGSVPVDTTLETRFRIRNTGATLGTITTLTLTGAGFQLFQEPRTPMSLLPNNSVDFFVRFRSATAVANAQATLRLNTASVTLLAAATGGTATQVRLLLVEDDGSRTVRTPDQTTVFASVERGQTATRRFVLENPGTAALTVTPFAVTGDSFQFGTAQTAPVQLAAGSTRAFDVVFRPAASGLKRATLDIGDRRFPLEGVGKEPAFPRPLLSLERTTLESAKQSKISVRFDAASRAEGTGELKLEFRPAQGLKDDAAVQFLPSNQRTVAFQVKEGQTNALFGSAQDVTFQTGTTAGTIRFVASMGGWTAESTVTLDGAAVRVDTGRAIRGQDLLDLTLTGFDNTRSVIEVAFTFYDSEGAAVAPGTIRANVEQRFRDFFDASTAGGMFSLRATFPVTGPVAGIRSFEAEFRNRSGTQRTQRFTF